MSSNQQEPTLCIKQDCYEKAREGSNYCSKHDPLNPYPLSKSLLKNVSERYSGLKKF
jgi:hypothetical protein